MESNMLKHCEHLLMKMPQYVMSTFLYFITMWCTTRGQCHTDFSHLLLGLCVIIREAGYYKIIHKLS